VDQVYLGAEDEVIARLTAAPSDDPSLPDTEHRRFGDVAAVWGMLGRLDAITVIDSVIDSGVEDPSSRGAASRGGVISGGVSVGTYLGLAALNRVCEPKSKRAFADWWSTTAPGPDHPDPGRGAGSPLVLRMRWTRSRWNSSNRSRRRFAGG